MGEEGKGKKNKKINLKADKMLKLCEEGAKSFCTKLKIIKVTIIKFSKPLTLIQSFIIFSIGFDL